MAVVVFEKMWKVANLVPVFKSRDKEIVVAEELFSINMNIVIVMFPFRSADLLFTCGQRIRT